MVNVRVNDCGKRYGNPKLTTGYTILSLLNRYLCGRLRVSLPGTSRIRCCSSILGDDLQLYSAEAVVLSGRLF